MPIEVPKRSTIPPPAEASGSPSSSRKRARVKNASASVTPPHDGEPAAKRLHLATLETLGPQVQAPLASMEQLRQLAAAIGDMTVDHSKLDPKILDPLGRKLKSLAHLGLRQEGASLYQAALIMLLEAGGKGDTYNIADALYAHVQQAKPHVLRDFLKISARWLPTANNILADQLASIAEALQRHPDASVSSMAAKLFNEFLMQAEVKRQVDEDPPKFDELDHAIAGAFKLQVKDLEGQDLDSSRYNIFAANRRIYRSGAVTPAEKLDIARLYATRLGNKELEEQAHSQGVVTADQTQRVIDRAKRGVQTVDIAVGSDEGHAIDLTVRVHGDRASVGILNSGNGTEYFHQFRHASKNRALRATSGLWVGGQKQGDGNCAVRANHMAERTLVSRELARRLATLRRAMYAYAYDKQSCDKSLLRKAGFQESKRLFKEDTGQSDYLRDYLDGEMRVDNIPLAGLSERLATFINIGVEKNAVQNEAMRKMYTFFGAVYSTNEALRMLPGNQGALALGTMMKMGLISLGGWGAVFVRPTTDLLAADFDAKAMSRIVHGKISAEPQKRPATARARAKAKAKEPPVTAEQIQVFLETIQARARAEGALHYSRLPEE